MSVYVYCGRPSASARQLTTWLTSNGGLRADKVGALPELHRGDLVVNWGCTGVRWPRLPAGARILNQTIDTNKYAQLVRLRDARVPVPDHTRTQPRSMDGWFARLIYHEDGADLLSARATGDYYVRIVDVVREFRVHSFLGKSILRGMKIPREGVRHPNPVVRSWEGGWCLTYVDDEIGSTFVQRYRDVAHEAVKALGLDFGAVDLGVTRDGSPVVFEVNTAPGDGGVARRYGAAIAELATS